MAAELDDLEAAVEREHPEPEPAAPAGGPDSELPPMDPTEEAVLGLAEDVMESPEQIAKLTRDDVADVLTLGFGLVADRRGKHWEMPEGSSERARLAKWIHKSIERHGWDKFAEWLPDLFAVAVLGMAISRRVQKDRELRAAPAEAAS